MSATARDRVYAGDRFFSFCDTFPSRAFEERCTCWRGQRLRDQGDGTGKARAGEAYSRRETGEKGRRLPLSRAHRWRLPEGPWARTASSARPEGRRARITLLPQHLVWVEEGGRGGESDWRNAAARPNHLKGNSSSRVLSVRQHRAHARRGVSFCRIRERR